MTRRSSLLGLPFVLLVCASGADAAIASGEPTSGVAARIRAAQPDASARLAFDVDSSGAQWVRGRTYKASFDAAGATYVPFLGSDAPRNHPVRLSLASATTGEHAIALAPARAAVREGSTVRIDRGVVDEVYELGLDSIEQTFVIEERPSGGDLRLFVAIETDLARGETADGLEYSNDRGSVRYGRAFVRESDGSRTPVASRQVETGVWIEIGADRLARASYPLVVDPVISTFVIAGTSAVHSDVDVSFDDDPPRWHVVYREVFSATDLDVVSDLLDENGTLVTRDYVDMSTENWSGSPRVANLASADQFLVVCTVDDVPGVGLSSVLARTVRATDHAKSSKFAVVEGQSDAIPRFAEVGGDPAPNAEAKYCVVWEHALSPTNSSIRARLVSRLGAPQGGPTGFQLVGPFNGAGRPRISRSNGLVADQRWNVVWERRETATNRSIVVSQVTANGTALGGAAVSVLPADEFSPCVSSLRSDGTYLVAWQRRDLGRSVQGQLRGPGPLETVNISALASSGLAELTDVSIDTDGSLFTLVYDDDNVPGAGSSSIRLATFATNANHLTLVESSTSLGAPSASSRFARIASKRSSGSPASESMVVWTETTHLAGALYVGPVGGLVFASCFGDGNQLLDCPCGNFGAPGHGCSNSVHPAGGLLDWTGHASLSQDDLQLLASSLPPNAPCTVFQGTTGSTGAVPFGDGLRCTSGTVLRLSTRNASPTGEVAYPTVAEPAVSVAGMLPASGGVRHYQVMYRNAAPYCTTDTFNVTNGVAASWLP